jgi:hypothetical protein
MDDTLRRQDLATLARTLQDQQARSLDVVTPAKSLRSKDGLIVVSGLDPVLEDDGVTDANGFYRPNNVGNEGISRMLGIPPQYLRKMHQGTEDTPPFTSLYDANVNGWLDRQNGAKWMLRLLRTDATDGQDGILRAVLSDRYRTIDNFQTLMAVLAGIRESGLDLGSMHIEADLTERRMIVRVHTREVALAAPELIGDYRSPFTGKSGADLPLVFAGFEITNSEVGNGSFSITPRAVFEVCGNGLKITKDAMREIHLGARLQEGVVRLSAKTVKANLALVTSQAQDAVQAFLTKEYLQSKVDEVREEMGVEITDAPKVITSVSKSLGFTEKDASNILGAFVKGGTMTAGGVMQAITAVAQSVEDGDEALKWEAAALPALSLAAAMR